VSLYDQGNEPPFLEIPWPLQLCFMGVLHYVHAFETIPFWCHFLQLTR